MDDRQDDVMSNSSDKIIAAYQQADRDASELLSYIESISEPEEIIDTNLPSLVKNIESGSSDVALKYIQGASMLGGDVAVAVGTSISIGTMRNTIAADEYTGWMVAPNILRINPFVAPFMSIPLAKKILEEAKVKRFIKENKKSLKQKQIRMKNCKDKILVWLNNLQKKAAEINSKLQKDISEKFTEYKENTKKLAKDISIQIDDCLNANTNKRILQYNEVILKQYKLQKDLEEKVEFLFDEYNNLLKQKQEVERQMNILTRLLNAMGCPESIINKALDENEV
ncbi:MAG: hypothetical protein ACI4I2_04925 [Oscillospiraceae bacterium]